MEMNVKDIKDFIISMHPGEKVKVAVITKHDTGQAVVLSIMEAIEFLAKWASEAKRQSHESRLDDDGFK